MSVDISAYGMTVDGHPVVRTTAAVRDHLRREGEGAIATQMERLQRWLDRMSPDGEDGRSYSVMVDVHTTSGATQTKLWASPIDETDYLVMFPLGYDPDPMLPDTTLEDLRDL